MIKYKIPATNTTFVIKFCVYNADIIFSVSEVLIQSVVNLEFKVFFVFMYCIILKTVANILLHLNKVQLPLKKIKYKELTAAK